MRLPISFPVKATLIQIKAHGSLRSLSRTRLPATLLRIFGVQGGSFGLKVFDGLGDQDQRKLVFDVRPQVLKAYKLSGDRVAPVAHDGSPAHARVT